MTAAAPAKAHRLRRWMFAAATVCAFVFGGGAGWQYSWDSWPFDTCSPFNSCDPVASFELSISAVAASEPAASRWSAPPRILPRDGDRLALTDRRWLIGAGPVAFHPSRPQLAWAGGETLYELVLDSGEQKETPIGGSVSDLGFSPSGDLWVLAGAAELWRGRAQVCRSADLHLDRLLGVDTAGITAANYWYSDGVGFLRRQLWIDTACRLEHRTDEPLSPNIQGADEDPGGNPRRASLRSPRQLPSGLPWTVQGVRVVVDGQTPIVLPSAPIAISPDGRWWVFEEAGRKVLWRLVEPQ